MLYNVNSLPATLLIGRQTETGVTEIGINCSAWLNLWPNLSLSIWVTPPGGAAAYPAATRMDGEVLVWTVNDGDTAVEGEGTMEVMGLADEQKKLSAIVTTKILRTTTGVTGEAPEPAQPWVDQVLNAAQTAATEAAEIAATEAAEQAAQKVQEIITHEPLPLTWVDASYINGETGVRHASNTHSASEAIDVSPFVNMTLNVKSYLKGAVGYAFYNAKPCNLNTYVGGANGNTSGMTGTIELEITVPENAAYLRITALSASLDECQVLPELTLAEVNKNAQKSGTRAFPRSVAMFGDSIMLGTDGDNSDARAPNTIPSIVGKYLDVGVVNFGVGGMGWIKKASQMNAYEKLASIDLTPYDVVTLCYGVNDHSQPIGETWDTKDETTCIGQFHKCVEYIYQQNPSCRVVVIGPFNGRNVGEFPDYWYGDETWGRLNDLLKQACIYYWLPYIDQHDGPINAFTIQTLIGADGVHPSAEGYKRLGEWIAGELRRLIG